MTTATANGTQVAPHNLTAEHAVLGAALLSKDAVATATALLEPGDFYSQANGNVYATIAGLARRGDPVDLLSVSDQLQRAGYLDQVGGTGHLLACQAAVPAAGNVAHYAGLVLADAARRRLIAATHEAEHAARIGDIEAARRHLSDALSDDHGPGLAWADVSSLWDEPDEAPALLTRTDHRALLYPGRIHWLMGESGKGKSMLSQVAALQSLQRGCRVIVLDWEAGPKAWVRRLRILGAARAVLPSLRVLERPGALTPSKVAQIAREARGADLVIIDSCARMLATLDRDENAAGDISKTAEEVLVPLAASGAAVLVIDHLVKAKDDQGLWPRGSGAKRDVVDGAAYKLQTVTPWSAAKDGMAKVIVAKDREGAVGAEGECVARMVVSHDAADLVELLPPEAAGAFRPTTLMERISGYLATSPTSSFNAINRDVTGKREHLATALRCLLDEGFVVIDGPGNHRLVKPYRTADEAPSQSPEPPTEYKDEDY